MELQDYEQHWNSLTPSLRPMGPSGINTDDEDIHGEGIHDETVSMSALDPARQSTVDHPTPRAQ